MLMKDLKISNMKPNELRIGNKVMQDKEICDVVSISGIKYSFNQQDVDLYYYGNNKLEKHVVSSLKPIPLTEEWFLKFGFNEGYSGYYHIGYFIISVKGQVYFGETEAYIAKIHFVHQLQNLYFALTGEELQILP